MGRDSRQAPRRKTLLINRHRSCLPPVDADFSVTEETRYGERHQIYLADRAGGHRLDRSRDARDGGADLADIDFRQRRTRAWEHVVEQHRANRPHDA